MNEERQPISFLAYLQAENIKLRQAVIDLSFETLALREALAREAVHRAGRERQATGPGTAIAKADRAERSAGARAVDRRSPAMMEQ